MKMDNNISSIKIISLNVRGLNKSIKRRKIFQGLHKQTGHCYFLQTYSYGNQNGVGKFNTFMDQESQ